MSNKLQVPHRKESIPGQPNLALQLYGVDSASNLEQRMAQGYYVSRWGEPVARAQLTPAEYSALKAHLAQNHPEHLRCF